MALGQDNDRNNKIYLGIKYGKVVLDKGNGIKENYSYVEGYLKNIYRSDRKFGNEMVRRWYIDLQDGDTTYSLCFSYSSGVFKTIILALASDEALRSSTPVRIAPYESSNYTKAVVYSDGIKLDWVTRELPPVHEVMIGSKLIKDDTERMKFIESLVAQINQRIHL